MKCHVCKFREPITPGEETKLYWLQQIKCQHNNMQSWKECIFFRPADGIIDVDYTEVQKEEKE